MHSLPDAAELWTKASTSPLSFFGNTTALIPFCTCPRSRAKQHPLSPVQRYFPQLSKGIDRGLMTATSLGINLHGCGRLERRVSCNTAWLAYCLLLALACCEIYLSGTDKTSSTRLT